MTIPAGIVASGRRASSSGYAAAVLADSPLAYYRLGETSGSAMLDSSGNARDGTYGASAALGATGLVGDSDKAIDALGTGIAGTVPSATWMNLTAFTVEVVFVGDVVDGYSVIASRWNGSSQFAMMFLIRPDAGVLKFYRASGGSYINVGSLPLVAGTRYHVVATYTDVGNDMRLYVNGALQASGSSGGANNQPTEPLTIGAHGGAGDPFDGRIDEFAFYGTALSAARVAAHHAAIV